MDQAASADLGLLRQQRERGEDANLDRGVDLCVGGDRAQAVGTGGQPVPDSTDSQPHALRENAHFMRPSGHRRGFQFYRKRQPTDSLQLLTGQQWSECISPSHKIMIYRLVVSLYVFPQWLKVVLADYTHLP